MKLSVIIMTFNEEANIGRCLESIKDVADEIVVVDSYSTDRTEDICRNMGVIFLQHTFEGYIEQEQYALGKASYDFVLAIDADEALSDRLKESIARVKTNWDSDGYSLNRLTSYCGKWIRHCGWYPDVKIRLWDRRKGQWGGTNPHPRVEMNDGCTVKHLDGDLLHYSYTSVRQQVVQINSFSDLAALAAYQKGKTTFFAKDILLNPVFTFLKMYLLQGGFLDGYYGFVICANSSYGKFLKYIKLREMHKRQDGHSSKD